MFYCLIGRSLPSKGLRRLGLYRNLHLTRSCLEGNGDIPVELALINKLKQVGTHTAQNIPKDRSLLKLSIWLIIFGSMLTHVIDKKHEYEEMEQRYVLKIGILKHIIERLKRGEVVDVQDELLLVNKRFEKKNRRRFSKPTVVQGDSNFAEHDIVKEESLDVIWKNILEDMNEPVKDQTLTQHEPMDKNDDICRDPKVLLLNSKQEKENLKFFTTTTGKRVTNDAPGQTIVDAKDTKMTKFL